jgi:predicted TIM-barrel fold metal-dependent hydrolase
MDRSRIKNITHAEDGIVDSHLHVIGDGKTFPYRADRAYEPPYAAVEELLAFHQQHDITRAVLVQTSVYGDDNGLLLEALQQHRERFRGVAVTGPAPGDKVLMALADSLVVGLRLNLMHGGGPEISQLERYAAVCRDAGFHLQIYVNGLLLPELAPILRRLPVTIVFDHFGGIPASLTASDHPALDALAGLLGDGAWVKLSAPYRVSEQQDGFRDVIPLGRKLIEIAPQRCVWGSDWPHVATSQTVVSTELLALMNEIALEPEQREAVFVHNPKRLYGFER